MGRSIRIKGEAELYAKLAHLPGKIAAANRRAVEGEVDEIGEDLRRDAPVLSGDLRDSIRTTMGKGANGRAMITARHAEFVLNGTEDTPANDFATPVILDAEQRFPERLRDEVAEELRGI